VVDGFAVWAESTPVELARAVLQRAGREHAWDEEVPDVGVGFLCTLAERLAEILWKDDRRVDVRSRAVQEAKEALYGVDRMRAPGVLFTIAPWTRIPAGTIADLHRACRPKLAEALIPFIGRILRSWCEEERLTDIGAVG
jgi:hypothetical protein